MFLVWLETACFLEVAFTFDKYLSPYIKLICVAEVVGWVILVSEIQKGIVAYLFQAHKLIH